MNKNVRLPLFIFLLLISMLIIAQYITKMLVQDEPITELYFDGHLALPRDYIPGAKHVFSFTIHNLEHQNTKYEFEVATASSGGKIVITKNNVMVKNNEYKTLKESINLATSSGKTKVEVSLLNKNQSIHFWTDNIYTPKK